MSAQPENKDKAEKKVSKGELSERELEKATGGSTSSGTVTTKWDVKSGTH